MSLSASCGEDVLFKCVPQDVGPACSQHEHTEWGSSLLQMLHLLEAYVVHHNIVLLVATALTRTLLTAQEATSRALQSLDAVNLIAATAQQQQLAAGQVSAQAAICWAHLGTRLRPQWHMLLQGSWLCMSG